MSAPRRIHVLHVSVATSGGIAAVVGGDVRDQVERGWRVTVACPSVGDLGYDAREAGAEVRWWRAGPAAGHLAGEVLRLRRIVRAAQPDVVHLHGARAGLAGRLAVRGRVPTVHQPHGWTSLTPGPGRRTARRWEAWADRWTTELVCVTDTERRVAEQLGLSSPLTRLAQGVDLARLRPADERDRARARARLGLDDVPTAVVVGTLAVRKGQQDLLVDWSQVRARVPDAQLVLVGDGPDRPALERQAAGLPGVVFAGARTDVPCWLAAADVVVVPSRWEGTSRVPLEAMASARSLVTTDVPGLAESVPEPAGAVVPLDDGPALVTALARRLDDPALADDEGWHGRAHAELHHDQVGASRDLARVYLRLVAARRGR